VLCYLRHLLSHGTNWHDGKESSSSSRLRFEAALYKLCHPLDALEVLWSQIFIGHRNRELLLKEIYKIQNSERIDDAALQQVVVIGYLSLACERKFLQNEFSNSRACSSVF